MCLKPYLPVDSLLGKSPFKNGLGPHDQISENYSPTPLFSWGLRPYSNDYVACLVSAGHSRTIEHSILMGPEDTSRALGHIFTHFVSLGPTMALGHIISLDPKDTSRA